MTQTTPPGWHPDPGHSGIGPLHERWWDGSRWTDQLRIPPATVRRRRMRIGAGIAAGIVVLAAVGGGGYLLGDSSGDRADTASTDSAPSGGPRLPGAPDGGGQDGGGSGGQDDDDGGRSPDQQMPQTEDGYATDAASGISIPVPDGWTGQSGPVGAGVTTGEYACPGDESEKCVRGGVFSAPAQALKVEATTAKAAAEADIKANAEESYGEKIYGGITSHEELKSGAVTVAGQKGYQVRWKVVTKNGDDGYVESLAFPSPNVDGMLVVVRSGFDVNAEAPKLSVLDDITKGIKEAEGAGSGTGETA
ncbi:DUF2510 domain-containing protein [Streptomyces sp. QL37]|uniref:DUF2510 domain-containing protein n=1 Tax=Streptomyces sp. QL37 TaxID=2093747 RepID=UPI000CF2ED4F|nr:DUF2510 domain-containing protein [Streptomyces sp. QL37]PPQ55855.1 hypothetical protein C5F59_03475 [Streptomyces sp. QL37]